MNRVFKLWMISAARSLSLLHMLNGLLTFTVGVYCLYSYFYSPMAAFAEQNFASPPPLPSMPDLPPAPPPSPPGASPMQLPPLPIPQQPQIGDRVGESTGAIAGPSGTSKEGANDAKPGAPSGAGEKTAKNDNKADSGSKSSEQKNGYNQSAGDAPAGQIDRSGNTAAETSGIEDRIIKLGTSAIDGVYYPLGSALCLYYNRDNNGGFASNPYCRAVSTSGSIANINGLKEAKLDLALVKSNWQKQALNGTGVFAKAGRYDNLRFVFSLHDESLAIIVKRESTIKTLNDMTNRVINIGKPGSSVRVVMDDIMKSKGWNYTNFKAVTELEHKDEVEALCSGQIDAMILIVEHPNSYIKKVTGLCETNIISVNDNDIVNFIRNNNEYKVTTIPGKIYLGIAYDVQTIGLKATLVAPNDTNDETIYKIAKATFGHLGSLKKLHPALQNLNMYSMLNDGRIAPMHAGVLKYLKEIGYDMNSAPAVPTKE